MTHMFDLFKAVHLLKLLYLLQLHLHLLLQECMRRFDARASTKLLGGAVAWWQWRVMP